MNFQQLKDLIEQNNETSNNLLKDYLNGRNLLNIIYPHGENLLHYAAGSNNIEMCDYLIKNGIHPNIYNSRGSSPLIYASLKNHINIVKLLISHNVDPRCRSGFSGLFPYKCTNSEDIKKILLDHDSIVPLDYENEYKLKNGYNLYQSFKYRNCKYWLTFVVNEMIKSANKSQIDSLSIPYKTDEIINTIKLGWEKLLEKYNHLYNDFLQSLNNNDNNFCLSCNKTDKEIKLLRCSKCKKIYLCNKTCQKNISHLHKYDCNEQIN
jgi:ankyrin repeat protein